MRRSRKPSGPSREDPAGDHADGRSYNQGAERYVDSLGECLAQRGHRVSYLAGDPLRLDRPMRLGEVVDAGRNLLAYPSRGWMTVVGTAPGKVRRWLGEHAPDLVHVSGAAHVGAGIMMASRQLGLPVVVTVHDCWWICPQSTLLPPDGAVCDGTCDWAKCVRCILGGNPRRWARGLARLPKSLAGLGLAACYARAAMQGMTAADMARWPLRRRILLSCLEASRCIIFPSQAISRVLAPRISHQRWRVIPNGLPREWFDDPRPAATAAIPADRLTVGYAGVLAPHKAPHLLLEAVRQLGWRDTTVRLAGPPSDPTYWRRLQETAAGLKVEFVGPLPAARMPAFLRGLDMLAVPSVWPENYPYVVLEAQAAGVPVVASRIGGMVEQVADERQLFEPGSVEGLAGAMEHVRRCPEACRSGNVATIEQMTDAVEDVYRQAVIGGSAGGAPSL